MANDEDTLKVLREIRDLQQKSLDAQQRLVLLVLPIFALMTMMSVLALAGFFHG